MPTHTGSAMATSGPFVDLRKIRAERNSGDRLLTFACAPVDDGQVIGSFVEDRILECCVLAADTRRRRRRRRRSHDGRLLRRGRRGRLGGARSEQHWNGDRNQGGNTQVLEASHFFGNVGHPYPPQLRDSSTTQHSECDCGQRRRGHCGSRTMLKYRGLNIGLGRRNLNGSVFESGTLGRAHAATDEILAFNAG